MYFLVLNGWSLEFCCVFWRVRITERLAAFYTEYVVSTFFFFCPSWSWVVEPSGLTLKTITLKWQQDSAAFAGLLGHPLVLFCMMLPCVLIYCSLMHYMHFCGYVCFWNNALLACIICIQYTVPWKSIFCLSDFVLFVYMSHLKVLDPQHILIIDKYNPKKYKVLFLNGDFMF